MVYSQICLNLRGDDDDRHFFNIFFPMDGWVATLATHPSNKRDLPETQQTPSVSQATAVNKSQVRPVLQAWGKESVFMAFFFYWTSVSTQGRYLLFMG